MQQWEYIGVRLVPESEKGRVVVIDPAGWKGTPLNELGRQGWEVVGVFRDNFWVLLKRPLAAQAPPTGDAAATATPAPAPAQAALTVEAALAQEAQPLFGLPDSDREQELERRLQAELQRRREGRPPEGGRRR
jgi:hypothetical protein